VQELALPIAAITAVLTTLAGLKTQALNLLGEPCEWGGSLFALCAALLAFLFLAYLWSRAGRVSRLVDPDALRLDPRTLEHLIGRTPARK
jgi:hypothetical protein